MCEGVSEKRREEVCVCVLVWLCLCACVFVRLLFLAGRCGGCKVQTGSSPVGFGEPLGYKSTPRP